MKTDKRKDILSTIGKTPVIELQSPRAGVRIYAKLEGFNPAGSVKDRISLKMIERAEAAGEMSSGRTLLEPTSGNTGIGMAMVGRLKGYRVSVVIPENATPERIQLLYSYGADIIFSKAEKGSNGAIELAQDLAKKNPKDYLMLYQHGNPGNPAAHYETTGPEIIEAVPEVDAFVAGFGTGGTLMGVGRRLKEHNPEVKIVAVNPESGDLIPGMRYVEDMRASPLMDLSLLDSHLLVSRASAIRTAKELLDREGLFVGISSGAAAYAAKKQAGKMERGSVVCLLPDGGWKYLSAKVWD